MVSDHRYSTSAWQRTRKAILRRYNHECQIRGSHCLGYTTTVHHIIPSSQAPYLFFADDNLVAACTRRNYSDGGRLQSQNRRSRVAQLETIIQNQQQLIDTLLARIASSNFSQGWYSSA